MKTEIEKIISGEISGEIKLSGFIDTIREHKKYTFLILRQKTDFIQIFIDKEKFKGMEFSHEDFIEVTGRVKKEESIMLHSMEIGAESIKFLGKTLSEPPISWKGEGYPSLSERLDHRHLSLREPKILLAFEIMSYFDMCLREFFLKERGFIEIHTPKIIGTSSEGGAELFEIEYFDKKAYLAQSPQIYKQMAIAAGFQKVMEIAPAFRADPSFTSRHVTEITMLDLEFGPISSAEEVMELEEDMLVYCLSAIKERYSEKIKAHYGIEMKIPSKPFPKITYKETVKILKDRFGLEAEEFGDMTSEAEKKIAEYVLEEFGHEFVFVTKFPSGVRAFYTMKDEVDPRYSAGFDLLYKGLEITSGAQREHRHDILRSQIIERGMGLEGFHHYLESFKHGIPPHGGYGFGFARLFKQMFGYETIKEMILMPRDPKRIFP